MYTASSLMHCPDFAPRTVPVTTEPTGRTGAEERVGRSILDLENRSDSILSRQFIDLTLSVDLATESDEDRHILCSALPT
jgi:hypothetical protein